MPIRNSRLFSFLLLMIGGVTNTGAQTTRGRSACLIRARAHTLPIFRALSIIAVALFFLSGGISPAVAQETVAGRVKNLRTHLSEVQTAYTETITENGQSAAVSARVEQLRADLREQLGQLLRKATSSEATLAVYRADAEVTLDAIRAYEAELGSGTGEATTFWNGFEQGELEKMRSLTRNCLNSLELDRLNIPPQQAPSSLEFRIREVKGWLDNIEVEINRRGIGNDQIRLKPIRGDLTVDEASTKYVRIKEADGPGNRARNFERKLARQVQLRRHSAPDDVALVDMERSLPDITPPKNTSIISRGPPDSFEAAQRQISQAQFDELNAVKRGDPVAIAKARARAATYRDWINIVEQEISKTDRLGFSATRTSHLQSIRDGWKSWHDHLALQQRSSPGASLEVEIREAEARIRELDRQIESRLFPRPPPPDGGDWNPDFVTGDPPSKGPNIRAFERAWGKQIAHAEVRELALVSNEYRTITNVEINEAISKAFSERVLAEAQSLRATYDEASQLHNKLFINGRGQEAVEAEKLLPEARTRIRAASGELLDFLSDPKLGENPASVRAKALLSDIVRSGERSATVSGEYNRALISLERARDVVDDATRTADVEIQAVSTAEVQPTSEYRIRLVDKPPQQSNIFKIKHPAEYTDLYANRGTSETLTDLIADPRRAPGGIIVDAALPPELSRRIESLNIDLNDGGITVSMGGARRVVKTPHNPLLARLAWAFVLDGRSALIDLRPLENSEASWLYWQYGTKRLSDDEVTMLIRQLRSLTSVRVNDAVRNTSIVPQLIAADQLMFDLLPQSSIAVEGEDIRYGLPLYELRRAFRADAGEELNQPNWQDTLYKKSLLAISSASYEDRSELVITPQFSFYLFGVPAKGNKALRLKASEQWFTTHQGQLRKLSQLSLLSDFASLVALFRSVHDLNVRNNLDDLITVPVPLSDVPRFIVRKSQMSPQGWHQLRDWLSKKEK